MQSLKPLATSIRGMEDLDRLWRQIAGALADIAALRPPSSRPDGGKEPDRSAVFGSHRCGRHRPRQHRHRVAAVATLRGLSGGHRSWAAPCRRYLRIVPPSFPGSKAIQRSLPLAIAAGLVMAMAACDNGGEKGQSVSDLVEAVREDIKAGLAQAPDPVARPRLPTESEPCSSEFQERHEVVEGTRGLAIVGGIEQEASRSNIDTVRACFNMVGYAKSEAFKRYDQSSGKFSVHDFFA